MKSTRYTKSLLALAVAGTPMALSANEEASAVLEEIIVTAQKRSESLGDVPIALSAFTGNFIKDSQANRH